MRSDVMVVGGSGGIGSAVVARYLEAGAHVLVVDQTPPKGTEDHPLSRNRHYIETDVTSLADLERMVQEVRRRGATIQHLISLAGGAFDQEFRGLSGTDPEIIERSVALNLTSHIWLLRLVLPLMTAVNDVDRSVTLVSSINAVRDFGLPAYSAAKAGLSGLVRSCVREFGERGIRINALLPGTVLDAHTRSQPKDLEALKAATALDRLVTPKEVADAIYALSHVMTSVTGQDIAVDCGQSVTTADWLLRDV